MLAVDTNIIVRLLTADDAEQYERAHALFEAEAIFIPKTVLLETEWVLRRVYGLQRMAVLQSLDKLVSLPNVRCEDEAGTHRALNLAHAGLDFADALHIASSGLATRFVTFDAALIKAAQVHALPASAP